MIVKILGILDIFIGICFWLFGVFGLISESFILILGLFVLIKGIVFITGLSFVSFLDIVSGAIIVIGTGFDVSNVVVGLVSIFLIQKGVFSLMG